MQHQNLCDKAPSSNHRAVTSINKELQLEEPIFSELDADIQHLLGSALFYFLPDMLTSKDTNLLLCMLAETLHTARVAPDLRISRVNSEESVCYTHVGYSFGGDCQFLPCPCSFP